MDYIPWSYWIHPRVTKMIQCMQSNLMHHINKRQKLHDHLNKYRKRIWENSTSFPNKNSYQSGYAAAAAAAKSLQSCPTLCDPRDGSPLGSPIPGILQARTLEWVAISFNAWKWKVKEKLLIRARLLSTPWTAAYQAPPSMGFSRQEYWKIPWMEGGA